MNIFTKSVISSLLASLFIVTVPTYADDTAVERKIEISAERGKDVTIHVESDNDDQMFVLSFDELADIDAVDAKLQALDPETIAKIKNALKSINVGLDGVKHKIAVHQLTLGDDFERQLAMVGEFTELEQLDELLSSDKMTQLLGQFRTKDLPHRIGGDDRTVIVIDASDSQIRTTDGSKFSMQLSGSNMVLKGHVDAILKMINHGQFSPEELDQIQQALDTKY